MGLFAPRLEPFALIVRKRGGGERTIEPHSFWVNRNTPRGEDAEFWERMPHNGRRIISPAAIIRKEPRPAKATT